jgi:hypothetical protein
MAIVLKEGKTYNPTVSAQFGIDMTNDTYYGVIDKIEYNKQEKICNFYLEIYGTQLSRQNGGAIVDRMNFTINANQFAEQIGTNGFTITDAYNKALETLTDWEGDI